MIITPFKHRFDNLKARGQHINYVLDIGAYRGDFTETIKSIWPNAIVWQFEADQRQKPWLNATAIYALLGDQERARVDYYTLSEDKITTGSSIFRELTNHYTDETTVVMPLEMTTLDKLSETHNFYGNWASQGLVKIDTQGSELLILSGAQKFLNYKKPKFILLECSIMPYNQGAPSFYDTVSAMHNYSYKVNDVFDLNYDQRGALLQTDILFERIDK